MKHATVGTWTWAEQTGGTLSRSDRRTLVRQAALLQCQRLIMQFTHRFGRPAPTSAVAALRIPDSPTALRAAAVCEQLSPVWLAHHCTRAFVWGTLLAAQKGLTYDEELLYVAAMLHDIGLTPAHNGHDATAQCFAVEGARAAKHFAQEAQWDARRQDALAEAICLHLNVTVSLAQGIEAHLLRAGSACDVIGSGTRAIAPQTRSLVLDTYPRLNMKREVDALLRQQVASRPTARTAMLYHTFHFGEMIAQAPFRE